MKVLLSTLLFLSMLTIINASEYSVSTPIYDIKQFNNNFKKKYNSINSLILKEKEKYGVEVILRKSGKYHVLSIEPFTNVSSAQIVLMKLKEEFPTAFISGRNSPASKKIENIFKYTQHLILESLENDSNAFDYTQSIVLSSIVDLKKAKKFFENKYDLINSRILEEKEKYGVEVLLRKSGKYHVISVEPFQNVVSAKKVLIKLKEIFPTAFISGRNSPVSKKVSFSKPLKEKSSLQIKEVKKIKEVDNRFIIKEFLIKGNVNIEEQKKILSIIEYIRGTKVSLSVIKDLKKKISQYYKNKNDLLTKVIVPKQNFSSGQLVLVILKAKVGKININGNKYLSESFIKNRLPKEGEILKYDNFVESVLLLNDYENINVKSLLKKGSLFGETDIEIQAVDKNPFNLNLMYDNLGSDSTSKHRITMNMSNGNLFKDADKVSLGVTRGFHPETTNMINTNYSSYIGDSHVRANIAYLYSDYIAGGDFSVLDILGDTSIISTGLNIPIERTVTDKINLLFNYKHTVNKNYLLGSISSEDALNVVNTSLNWENYKLLSTMAIDFSLSKGLWNKDEKGTRLNQDVNFLKANLDMSYNGIINKKNSYQVRLASQYSENKLPVSEMFYVGGLSTIRGFESSREMGDSGYALSLEWFYSLENHMRIGSFVDFSRTFVVDPIPGENTKANLIGTGVEFIATINDRYSIQTVLGIPIYETYKSSEDGVKLYTVLNIKLW